MRQCQVLKTVSDGGIGAQQNIMVNFILNTFPKLNEIRNEFNKGRSIDPMHSANQTTELVPKLIDVML